jgi:hypothetical protein
MNLTPFQTKCRPLPALATALASLLAVLPVRAVVLDFGQVKGSFDTTLSVGVLSRLNEPDPALYGITNSYNGAAGQQRSVNADDGNLNYKPGLTSALIKANHDLELNFQNAGLFVRGYYFKDFVNADGDRNKVPLGSEANRIVSEGGELLDAYVFYRPTFGTMPARIAVGNQVLSWGESTFIPNGINSINPIDVAKLRTPGSELKEALRPLNMVSASLGLTPDLTLEGFYLLDWERTRVDPPGTYFSTNDFVAQGGRKVYLGFGAIKDTATLGYISRGTDRVPRKSHQYGVNLRWLAQGLGDTEFGLYYMNYHSRLPMVSAQTPSGPISAAVVQGAATNLGQTNLAPAMIAAGIPAATVGAVLPNLLGAALLGVPSGSLPASLQPYAAFYPAAQSIATGAKTVGFLTAANTGQYVVDFPEDIHLVGASFNTSIKGVAFQGEISYRDNQPLQVDDVELLFAALSPLDTPGGTVYGANNQLGNYAGRFSTYVPGYRRHKVWTGQMTGTWVGRGVLGAQQSTLLAETGFVHADLPAKSKLRYDGPGTFVAGDLNEMANTGNAASGSDPASAFADKFSWGYQLVSRLDYNNVFHGVNVSPLLVFAHDVGGNTPLPLGNFLHGRKTITLGADFTYQNAWACEVRYVNFTGGGKYNLLSDRDYVSVTLKYSF